MGIEERQRRAGNRIMTLTRLFVVLWTFGAVSLSMGTERSAIVRSASTIVVGTMRDVRMLPWFDGWHISGSIVVETALMGSIAARDKLSFRFVCSCCPLWPRPDTAYTREKGIWFLVPSGQGTWGSAGSCSDPGYRPLSGLDDYRRDIRLIPKKTP